MATHRGGYAAYQKHRRYAGKYEADGMPRQARAERKAQEANRPAYTAYRRAYAKWLALRKQQGA